MSVLERQVAEHDEATLRIAHRRDWTKEPYFGLCGTRLLGIRPYGRWELCVVCVELYGILLCLEEEAELDRRKLSGVDEITPS